MKKLFFLLCACVVAGIAYSQTVTINVTGNRNKQIAVDGRNYTISNATTLAEQEVVISDLSIGQHTLQVTRSNINNNRNSSVNTSFTLREGYDLDITINSTGAVSMTEKKNVRNNGTGVAISTAAFNKLLTATRNKVSSASRAAYLENEFTNTNKRFTSKQASQLIQLVNTESLRLALAKNAYTRVTDPANFSLVRNLLNSTANRNSLDSYIARLPVDEDDDDNGNAYTPISNQKFQTIYNEVLAETNNSDRNYYLSNFFTKDFNYYTSAQARQLIQLVSTEQERFYLAKVAYRGITDRQQYDQVVQLLNTNSNRTELRTYIASYDVNNNNNTGVAMTSTVFNKLYQSVSYQTSTTGRYNAVNTALTTSDNYFTASQARQLIQLVNNESNRLILAKTAYKVLTDRTNYTVMNDLFTSQSNRNDLADFVYSYNNTGTNTGMAMSNAEFNSLYSKVSAVSTTSSRYSLINTAFLNSNNYFSATQERTLLMLINSESNRLELAKTGYDNIVDKNNYTVMSDLFTSSSARNEWARYAGEYGSGTGAGVAMTTAEFNSLYNNVYAAWSASSRYSLVQAAFENSNNYFTATQARQLLLLINSESERLSLAKIGYDNVVDRNNYAVMSDLFASSTNRNEWVRYANEYSGGGTWVKTPMTDTEFNSLYRNIQLTFGIGAKMSNLTNAFNVETNYFTVAQARQLIQLVSAENNRLELTKLVYGNLTDPANYTQFYDILASQASRDELNTYVGSNAYLNN
ncbi:MAG TPA: DUF4476 domain-containing protein [Chitinophagaceae bacterium]|jgi:hypothetical protein|nr:DUF4476 domain-containing protein [Chitinophagaceae bacterium]